jgi:hypothetical protein
MSILKDLRAGIAAKIKSGILVHFKDTEVEHTNVTGDMSGFEKIYQAIEEQTASGLDIDPALLGRTYSTTETYAGDVFAAFFSKLSNFAQPVENALKKFVSLHLRAKGYNFDRISAKWGPAASIDKRADAEAHKADVEADRARFDLVLAKLQSGLISQETAARELGYESWSDPTRIDSAADAAMSFGQHPEVKPLKLAYIADRVKKKSA